MITHLGAMKMAIDEAQRGFGFVAPNPPVGCVILDQAGNLLAKGHHKKFGGDHAEIDALKHIKNPTDLKGATLYVTLEPCAHEGKTPSCAKALAKLPLKKVVYGLEDPNPLVSGKGAAILRAAGIEAEKYMGLQDELEELAEVFLWNHRQNKTFVTLKIATSLDGQIAYTTGGHSWLTGAESREHVHFLRASYDAILVGKNTILKDNPKLDIRHPRFTGKQNKVVILDSHGETIERLPELNVAGCHKLQDIIVFVGENTKIKENGIQVVPCPTNSKGLIDLESLLRKLYEKQVMSLFVEGGAQVACSFLQQKLIQRYCQFIAPVFIGKENGISFTAGLEMAKSAPLRNTHSQMFGTDFFITGRF